MFLITFFASPCSNAIVYFNYFNGGGGSGVFYDYLAYFNYFDGGGGSGGRCGKKAAAAAPQR